MRLCSCLYIHLLVFFQVKKSGLCCQVNMLINLQRERLRFWSLCHDWSIQWFLPAENYSSLTWLDLGAKDFELSLFSSWDRDLRTWVALQPVVIHSSFLNFFFIFYFLYQSFSFLQVPFQFTQEGLCHSFWVRILSSFIGIIFWPLHPAKEWHFDNQLKKWIKTAGAATINSSLVLYFFFLPPQTWWVL